MCGIHLSSTYDMYLIVWGWYFAHIDILVRYITQLYITPFKLLYL